MDIGQLKSVMAEYTGNGTAEIVETEDEAEETEGEDEDE